MKCLLIAVSCIFLNFHQALSRASAPIYVSNENEFENYKIDDFVDQEIEESGLRLLTNSSNIDESSEENTNIPEGRVYYNGSQLWKVEVTNPDAVTLITNFEKQKDISMWGGNATYVDILVSAKALDRVRQSFKENNINYILVIDDVQRAIDEENPTDLELDDRRGHRLTWQAYHRTSDINGYLDYLALTYPDLCTVQTIGSSVQGKPIKVLKISSGKTSNKAVWVDGGIHAREWITPASVTYMINQIVSNFESQPDFIQNLDWYFAPLLNPDGYEYTHTVDRLWRKNRARGNGGRCAGTDLNRNFGYRWGGQGSSKNPCTETFGGTGPFSEPETAAVERFIRGVSGSSANWKAYVSFHSYGQYILYPWGYDRVVPPDYKDLEVVAKKAAAAIIAAGGPRYTTGPAGGTLYPASGGSDDWAKGTMKFKYAYTIELRDSGRYGFVLPASYIQPTAREAFAALKVIAQAAAAA